MKYDLTSVAPEPFRGIITVESWNAASDELLVHIYNDDIEVGGWLRCRGVRQICLPPRLSIRSIRVGGGELRNRYSGDLTLDSGETLRVEHVVIFDPDLEGLAFIIARSVDYEVRSDSDS
jgi:hypothetical protein